jgi:[ribosomal protein S5]-alanine N-acetyltransferase
MPPTIDTERLHLRSLEPADAGPLFELISDRAIADTTATIPHPYERHMAGDFIAARTGLVAEEAAMAWAIVRRVDSAFLGVISLSFEPELESAEVGYWLGVPFWGQGFATEACTAVVDHGFRELPLARIHGVHLARNPASGVVLQRAGMRHEGIRRRAFRKWGALEDLSHHSILREEWIATHE